MKIQVNMTNSCMFYLVRHGETEWNKSGRIQGHTDIVLNAFGVEQARQRAHDFKDTIFHAAFSSDLKRAEETARILIEGRQIEFQTVHSLREQSWGEWEGTSIALLRERFGVDFNQYTGMHEHRTPGAESHLSIANRLVPFLHETATKYVGQNVLVVTHGGVLKSLIYCMGLTDLYRHSFNNLGYMKVRVENHQLHFEGSQGLVERSYVTTQLT